MVTVVLQMADISHPATPPAPAVSTVPDPDRPAAPRMRSNYIWGIPRDHQLPVYSLNFYLLQDV